MSACDKIPQNVAILIPAYNEQATITTVIDGCLHYTSHIYVIDDGSTDETLSVLKKTTATVYADPINQGKGSALTKGFSHLIEKSYAGVITLDADGQHNPDDLPHFFDQIQKNPDQLIIGARRFNAQQAPRTRLLANKVADFFISCAAKKSLYDTQSGFRYYPISFLKHYFLHAPQAARFALETEILIQAVKMGVAIAYVNIASYYPENGRGSYYRPWRDSWEIATSVWKNLVR